ncbi:MAG: T9SS type A sorting domain-containing protein [Bacteroidetes bacterium]|nr:MAG: T9SS type A sorting domain-containing protein [Bacteroidota bacterium]
MTKAGGGGKTVSVARISITVYYSSGTKLTDAGAAYIFERVAGVWTQTQKIVASDRAASDNFGYSVSISGNYAVVSANMEDEDAAGGNTANAAGSAYIFERVAGVWTQAQKLVASDRAASDNFGRSVSISGDYAIVGAELEDEDAAGSNTILSSGSAYIFERVAGVWTQAQKIVASDRATIDFFGVSVSISGNFAIAGAFRDDEDASGGNTKDAAGSSYIFERVAGVWTQVQKIDAFDRDFSDEFGFSVGISPPYAIVGAWLQDYDASGGASISNGGAAYVFGDVVTPVELLYFNAIPENNSLIKCEWSTATEINNDYFAVERSMEEAGSSGILQFEQIGMVQGSGNSNVTKNYVFYDEHPYKGLSYYRLRQVDYNGQYEYSPVRMVYIGAFEIISIYPNPGSEYIHYAIGSETGGEIALKLYDVMGREILNKTEMTEAGITQKKLNTSALSSGTYVLKIINGKKEKAQKQFAIK